MCTEFFRLVKYQISLKFCALCFYKKKIKSCEKIFPLYFDIRRVLENANQCLWEIKLVPHFPIIQKNTGRNPINQSTCQSIKKWWGGANDESRYLEMVVSKCCKLFQKSKKRYSKLFIKSLLCLYVICCHVSRDNMTTW
jgi:hypothetical protein